MTDRRRNIPALPAIVLAGFTYLVGACHRREAPVAVLQEARGSVERSDSGDWISAPTQTAFSVGDLLRTGPGAGARLRLIGGGVIKVGENARIRFSRGAPSPERSAPIEQLAIEQGSAEIEDALEGFTVSTVLGPLRMEKGTRLHVRSDGEVETIEVLVGRVILFEGGKSTAIGAGQGVRLKFGRAEIEHFRIQVGPATMDQGPTEPPQTKPEAPAVEPLAQAKQPEQAAQRKQEPQPGGDSQPTTDKGAFSESAERERVRADVTLIAGENAAIHDPKSALNIRLRFDHICSGRATLEASGASRRQRLTGIETLVLRVRAGMQRYRIRCDGSSSAETKVVSGALRLLRDSGNLQLSRRAPVDTIEADGRHYTILFQTRLPVLWFTWAAAPANAGPLKLNVDVAGQVKVFATAEPRYELPSGALPEGTYTWSYSTDDGRHSPNTTVTIRFDNAAPTAQFFSADGGDDREGPATGIRIKGVALEGTKVTVAGQPLTLDDRGRFRTTVTPPEGDDAVAVRLEHPRNGIHYYVRRPDGPPDR